MSEEPIIRFRIFIRPTVLVTSTCMRFKGPT